MIRQEREALRVYCEAATPRERAAAWDRLAGGRGAGCRWAGLNEWPGIRAGVLGLLDALDAAEKRAKAAEQLARDATMAGDDNMRDRDDIMRAITRYQPAGSPPPGGAVLLASAVVNWLAQRAAVEPGPAHRQPPLTWSDTVHPDTKRADAAEAQVARLRGYVRVTKVKYAQDAHVFWCDGCGAETPAGGKPPYPDWEARDEGHWHKEQCLCYAPRTEDAA